jgi:hypothetical protein
VFAVLVHDGLVDSDAEVSPLTNPAYEAVNAGGAFPYTTDLLSAEIVNPAGVIDKEPVPVVEEYELSPANEAPTPEE